MNAEIFMQIKDMALHGNIIDNGWIENIKFKDGKPNMIAIMILSEIIYWYIPSEIRDEYSGRIIGYKKKFKADKLQKQYQDFADRFGITKRQAINACKFLKDMNIITIEFRRILNYNGKFCNNVMFIEPVVENLKRITGINRVVTETNCEHRVSATLSLSKVIPPPTFKSGTYTENTFYTENTSVCPVPKIEQSFEGRWIIEIFDVYIKIYKGAE